MTKFLVNISVLLFVFFGILISIYISLDPFKVVKEYDNYSDSLFIVNKDYVCTETFLKNYKRYHYNSFVFGSSRTMGFNPEVWADLLIKSGQKDVYPMTFDAFEETIVGIYNKLLLVKQKVKIKNVLIILCRDKSFDDRKPDEGLVLFKHPKTSTNTYFDLHFFYFKNFINPDFFRRFLEYKLFGDYKPYMRSMFSEKKINIDPKTNFLQFETNERWYDKDSVEFLTMMKQEFDKRSKVLVDTMPRIKNEHKIILDKIYNILKTENVNYKIILSPLFEQLKWHPNDFNLLKNLFGSNLVDYSGINNFTNNKLNYYESSHFRPIVGNEILQQMYAN